MGGSMATTKRCSVDRIEGDILVLISDDGFEYHLKASDYSYKVNDVVDVSVDRDKIILVKNCPEEKERRLKENRSRLSSLFAKGKK
jgi:hypothetical protein